LRCLLLQTGFHRIYEISEGPAWAKTVRSKSNAVLIDHVLDQASRGLVVPLVQPQVVERPVFRTKPSYVERKVPLEHFAQTAGQFGLPGIRAEEQSTEILGAQRLTGPQEALRSPLSTAYEDQHA